MFSFLIRRWFLITLLTLIALGMAMGWFAPAPTRFAASQINPLLTTAMILFLMSFSLETSKLQAALKMPLPVSLGAILNIGLAPLLGLALMPMQLTEDFRYGLLVASIVPCTMAAASVWTRKAHGNDAISLLVTLVTNIASILTVPLWLNVGMSLFPLGQSTGNLANGTGLLRLNDTVVELVVGVLLPIFLGQLMRQPAKIAAVATHRKQGISIAAQCLILLMVWTAAARGGARLAETKQVISLLSVLLVWSSVIIVHVVTLYSGLYLSRWLGIDVANQIAVAFAGSQKTLPVGLLVSEVMARQAGLSFTVFPMLMYHGSQLFLDTIIADQFAVQAVTSKKD